MNTPSGSSARYGKYILLDQIGRGGMSDVFLAKTEGIEGFERKFALKRIFPSLTNHPEFVRSFIHEAKVGGMLYHHNVVQTLDFGRVNDTYFIALEYVEGTNLGTLLMRCKELHRLIPPAVYMQLALQICEGLEYIHTASVEGNNLKLVHRDIKPSNMLITNQGLVKISDFGVVKASAQAGGHTRVGAVKGTIGYMSPEQARGEEVTASSDLFALGAMLYETATLKRLYGDGDELSILARVRDSQFVEPIEAAGSYIPGLDTVIRRLLSRAPRDRYANAGEVANALRALPVPNPDRSALIDFVKSLGLFDRAIRETGRRPGLPPPSVPPPQRSTLVPNLAQQPIPPVARPQAPPPQAPAPAGMVPQPGRQPLPQPTLPPGRRPAARPGAAAPFANFRTAQRQARSWLVILGGIAIEAGGAAGGFLVMRLLEPTPPTVFSRPMVQLKPAQPSLMFPQSIPNEPVDPAAPFKVYIQTIPPGASVLIDGDLSASSTPVELTVKPGQSVEVRREGYQAWQKQAEADPTTAQQRWIVTLTPN